MAPPTKAVVLDMADLIEYRSLISMVREGEPAQAFELLELSIDYKVCSLWPRLAKTHEFTREQVMQTLIEVKRYRERFPRRLDLVQLPADAQADVKRVAEEARRILESITDPQQQSA